MEKYCSVTCILNGHDVRVTECLQSIFPRIFLASKSVLLKMLAGKNNSL